MNNRRPNLIPFVLSWLILVPPGDGPARAQPAPAAASAQHERLVVSRVTTAVPFPRGLVMVDGDLYVLARGRVRSAGGVSAAIDDRAGTIFKVNPNIRQPLDQPDTAAEVATNGVVFAEPTDPPFRLWDQRADPPETDQRTDRPYCALRYDEKSNNFFICAFSGIDKPGQPAFSKNFTDALLRYDLRTRTWYEVERHQSAKADLYPHHDPRRARPPHGWLKGPDNCLVIGDWLYAVAKDNSVLVRYDLREIRDNPRAEYPRSELVLGSEIPLKNAPQRRLLGHSALAVFDGYLYIAFRTTSEVVRVKLDATGNVITPVTGELIATFDPHLPSNRSADITDIAFDRAGNLHVLSAEPAKIFRFRPDPANIFDGRTGAAEPWAPLHQWLNIADMKSENLLVTPEGVVFVTSAPSYGSKSGALGTVYRIDRE